jgi:hypothetical protein
MLADGNWSLTHLALLVVCRRGTGAGPPFLGLSTQPFHELLIGMSNPDSGYERVFRGCLSGNRLLVGKAASRASSGSCPGYEEGS